MHIYKQFHLQILYVLNSYYMTGRLVPRLKGNLLGWFFTWKITTSKAYNFGTKSQKYYKSIYFCDQYKEENQVKTNLGFDFYVYVYVKKLFGLYHIYYIYIYIHFLFFYLFISSSIKEYFYRH